VARGDVCGECQRSISAQRDERLRKAQAAADQRRARPRKLRGKTSGEVCECGCGQFTPPGRRYARGHGLAVQRDLDRVAHLTASVAAYLPAPRKPRARYQRDQWYTTRHAVDLPTPRQQERDEVARMDDDRLLRALREEGPLAIHSRSGVRQRSRAAAIVDELVARCKVPVNCNLAKRHAQADRLSNPCHEFVPGVGTEEHEWICRSCGGDQRRPLLVRPTRTPAATAVGSSKEPGATVMATASKTTKSTPRQRAGTPTPAQRDAAVAERDAIRAQKQAERTAQRSQRQAEKAAVARAKVDRYAAAKKAAAQGKSAAKVLAQPLKVAVTPRAPRANGAVPEELAPYRGNYSAPAGMTQAEADAAARKLTAEALSAKLLLMQLKKGGFRTVEKQAFLSEAARRLHTWPTKRGGNGRKAAATKAPAPRKAPAKTTAKTAKGSPAPTAARRGAARKAA
jgi:hypothetical protein